MNRVVLFAIGILMVLLGVLLVIPAIVDAYSHDGDWHAFAFSSLSALFFGGLLMLTFNGHEFRMERREGYFLTLGSWMSMSLVGALPFWMSDLNISFTDAVFESVSGLTTTGSTVLSGLDSMPPGILLWRGLLQWVGGIGIIVMAVTLFPFLRIGGMQLYRMETSDQYDKFMPRIADVCLRITVVYVVLTLICGILYWAFGMTGFEAVIHAMTTLSTGGYSTSDQSIGHFAQPSIQWVAVVFMLAGSLPFSLYIRYLHQFDAKTFSQDSQTFGFLSYTAIFIAVTVLFLSLHTNGAFSDNVRLAAFNVVSVISTTGYASADYLTWGAGAATLFFFLSMLGGCAGSTAGGLKAFRLLAMVKGSFRQGLTLSYPNGIFAVRLGNKKVNDDALDGVYLFFFIMMSAIGLITIALALTGLDFTTSISAAVTAVANVGPGLGTVIGPTGNFEPLSNTAKWVIDVGMIAGRLEFLAIMILFLPDFWAET